MKIDFILCSILTSDVNFLLKSHSISFILLFFYTVSSTGAITYSEVRAFLKKQPRHNY